MPAQSVKLCPEKSVNSQGEETDGVLAPICDPLGRDVETGLQPVGGVVRTVTAPIADGAAKVVKPVRESMEADREKKDEGFGGKEQTAGNPLGL